MPFVQEWEYFWVTQDRGLLMKKLNTHSLYILGQRMRILNTLEHREGMTLTDVFWNLVPVEMSIKGQISGGFFSPSLKRSAGFLLRAIYDLGIPDKSALDAKMETAIHPWQIDILIQKASDFETVLANELPGLATYV